MIFPLSSAPFLNLLLPFLRIVSPLRAVPFYSSFRAMMKITLRCSEADADTVVLDRALLLIHPHGNSDLDSPRPVASQVSFLRGGTTVVEARLKLHNLQPAHQEVRYLKHKVTQGPWHGEASEACVHSQSTNVLSVYSRLPQSWSSTCPGNSSSII